MSRQSLSEAELTEVLTGMVVESLAVKQDFGASTIGCRRCEGTTLAGGDHVTVAVSCYENHSWEIEGIYCETHDIADVPEVMSVRAEQQVVVRAVLETAGYHPPRGGYEPDALTLGDIQVLDYSPTSDGY